MAGPDGEEVRGSDLHLSAALGAFLSAVHHIAPGDRVVIPFNISCAERCMCPRGLYAQCETTQIRAEGSGPHCSATRSVRAGTGRAGRLVRVPQAQFGPIKLPVEGPDERWVFLSDVPPTAW